MPRSGIGRKKVNINKINKNTEVGQNILMEEGKLGMIHSNSEYII